MASRACHGIEVLPSAINLEKLKTELRRHLKKIIGGYSKLRITALLFLDKIPAPPHKNNIHDFRIRQNTVPQTDHLNDYPKPVEI